MTSQSQAARSRARRFALQALYQLQFSDNSSLEVEKQFLADHDMKRVDTAYLHELLSGIEKHNEDLVSAFTKHLDREESELDAISRAALLIGAFEIVHRIDIPYRVAINEGVELAKQFGAEDSHKFVNGVLDLLAGEFRTVEKQNRKR